MQNRNDFVRSMLEDADDLFVVLNPDMTIRDANRAFRDHVEMSGHGERFLDLVELGARERVLPDLVQAAGGGKDLVEIPHVRRNDSPTVVEYRFFPLEDGLTAGIGRVRDAQRALGEQLGRTEAELRAKSRMLDEIQMELTQVPFIDPVTGVWNRLQVIERLASEWSRTERWGSPLACLMIDVEDLDDTRRVEGNAVADEVLKAVARRIKGVVRDHDIVGRYGGNLFVVIAVHADLEGGRSLSRRLLEHTKGEPVAVAGRQVSLKVRVGCCTNASEGVEIMEDLFEVSHGALADARAQAMDMNCIS